MKIVDRFKDYVYRTWFDAPGLSSTFVENLGVPPTQNSRQVLEDYKGIVYAAISTIAQNVSAMENYYAKEMGNGDIKVDQHEFLRLLENPNPDMTKKEFIEATESFMQMVGECFWYFKYGEVSKKPKEIYILRPDRVKIVVSNGEVVGYKVSKNGDSDAVVLDTFEIYHKKRFNPNNPYRGIGPLQAGLQYVNTEKYATDFTKNFLFNNATPSGVLVLGKDMTKEAYATFKRRWREGVSGTRNAGKVAIIRGTEATFTKVGLSLSDIDLKELKKMTEDSILKMFKVPESFLGVSSETGLGRASVETLEYIFTKWVIDPIMATYDSDFEKIIKRFYKESVDIRHKNIVPEDKEFELNRKDKAVDRWMSRDEIRRSEGVDAIGANKLYVPFNQTEIEGVDTNTKKTKTLKIRVKTNEVVEKDFDFDVTDKSDNAPQEIFRKNTIENTTEQYVIKVMKKVKTFLKDQEKRVLDQIPDTKSVTAKGLSDSGLNINEETTEMEALILPIVLSLVLDVGNEAKQFAGGDGEFELTDVIKNGINEHLLRGCKSFHEETAQELADTLAEGIANNETGAQLKKRVGKVYDGAEKWRNERLARNENHWSAVRATEEAFIQSGVQFKQWYANPGACQYCRTFDGKVVRVGASFFPQGQTVVGEDGGKYDNNYEEIENSHLHPNCKCQLLPLDEQKSAMGGKVSLKAYPIESIKEQIALGIDDKIKAEGEKIGRNLAKKYQKKIDTKVKEMDKTTKRLGEILDEEEDNKGQA
jgi:HK97 family phage portal protein